MFETAVADGVLRVGRPDTRWLSTGWDGGFRRAHVAYNVSVPTGWEREDLDAYVAERLARAGFAAAGPALLTGVELQHARGARLEPVVAYATAGLSNPAALPVEPGTDTGTPTGAAAPPRGSAPADEPATPEEPDRADDPEPADPGPGPGTVNLLVGTTRALEDGALASLLGVVVEAKTATLLAETGFPGTTTDAAVVGTATDGEPATFAGSATAVGSAARACVREAVRASLRSRYAGEPLPSTVAEADHGVVTDRRAEVFRP